jgi:hypothetical protein
MPIQIGLDTSHVLGLIDDQDLWHAQALQLQGALDAGDFHISIFDFDADFDRVPGLKRVSRPVDLSG